MKNIKIKWNEITLLYILLSLFSGYIKNTFLVLLIVLIHELGHVFFLHHYEYPILKVEIFPFGGITTTDKKINTPLKKECIIASGGLLFQTFLFLLFFLLFSCKTISLGTYQLFLHYNTFIFLFNLLPIYPLDGSIFFRSFLEKKFSYVHSYWIYLFCSLLFFFLFSLLCFQAVKDNWLTMSFLLFQLFELYKARKHLFNRFFLERLLYENPYEFIRHEDKQDITTLKKDTLHFFKEENKYVHEREILRKKFDIHSYF